MKKILLSLVILALAAFAAAEEFTVTITNISNENSMSGEINGAPVLLSPGAWAVFAGSRPLFDEGEADRGDGLEALAEDGNPSYLVEALSGMMMRRGTAATDNMASANFEVLTAGGFNTPRGADGPGPLMPGESYSFKFDTDTFGPLKDNARLVLATMFVQSNDLFYAPTDYEDGIALFQDGKPLGDEDGPTDITDSFSLWDAGTESFEEPGLGPNQAPRQSAPDTGETENGVVQLESDDAMNAYDFPDVKDIIQVEIELDCGIGNSNCDE